MSDANNCPKCGAALPARAPGGICPKCVLRAAMEASNGDEISPYAVTTPQQQGGFIPPEPELLALSFPHLELLECLGSGGMGAVYKARQKKLDRMVALKIIRPEAAEDPTFALRFNREARTLARLNHPCIVAIHDFGEVEFTDTTDGTPRTLYYFLMEYVKGLNLRQLMQQGELSTEQSLALVPQICEALQFAHDEGVVHRDIKPENILVDQRWRVKIADFGLAKLASPSEQDLSLTGTHQVMGTPRYMAPEQMAGSKTVDHRADIYSLGVVFYEMLTGQIPAGHFEPPSARADIDDRLDAVVMRALAREPESRFQQAHDLKLDVEKIYDSEHDRFSDHPGSGDAPDASGFSTIVGRELSGAWRWVKGKPAPLGRRARQDAIGSVPQFPWLLMVALSLLGVLLTFAPWYTLHVFEADGHTSKDVDAHTSKHALQSESLRAANARPIVQVDGRDAYVLTLHGIERLPGKGAATAFTLICVLLLITPSTRRLSWQRAGTMMALSGGVLLAVSLYTEELQQNSFHSSRFQNVMVIRALDHELIPHGGFIAEFVVVGLLLSLSAAGVRNGVVQASQPRSSHRLVPASHVEPVVPRFSLTAIFGGVVLSFAILLSGGIALALLRFADHENFLFPAAILCFGAILTTICGFVAVSQIRNSQGRLTGLGLACFDILAFPLIAIDMLIFVIALMLSLGHQNGPTIIQPGRIAQTLIFTLLIGGVIDALIVYFVWRKLSNGSPVATAQQQTGKPSFSGSPVAQLQFMAGTGSNVLSQADFHFSSLGYRLITRDEETCVFQRGNWLGGMLETDIRKLFTQLTVRISPVGLPINSAILTPPAAAGLQRISCQWSVKTWGAWVSGRDVRSLEAEGHDFKAMLTENEQIPPNSPFPPVSPVVMTAADSGARYPVPTEAVKTPTEVDAAFSDAVESTLDAPALGLMIVGCLMATGHAALIYNNYHKPAPDSFLGWLCLAGPLIGLLMFNAGLQIKFVQSRAWALIGCYAALLPLSPGWIISVAVGWVGMTTLKRSAVIELFAQRRRQRQRTLPPLPAHIRPDIDGPSLLLIIVGMCTFLGNLGAVTLNLTTGADPDELIYVVGGLVTGIGMSIGGARMREARSLGWAQVGAVAAMIPVSVGWPITLWVGIWCFSNLNSPHVRKAFAERGH